MPDYATPLGSALEVAAPRAGSVPPERYTGGVAIDSDGDFVVAWVESIPNDAAFEIYAQRYDSAGAKQGSQIFVAQSDPRVTVDVAASEDGQFVVLWRDAEGNLLAQQYTNQGTTQGSQITVFTSALGQSSREANVDMDSDGDFVVTWLQENVSSTPNDSSTSLNDSSTSLNVSSTSIIAQQYTAQGVAGSQIIVDTATSDNTEFQLLASPTVAVDDDGDFVVAWRHFVDGQTFQDDVRAQRYSSAGVVQGNEIVTNVLDNFTNSIREVNVDADAAGNFALAWLQVGDGAGFSVGAQLFSNTGVAGSTLTVVSPGPYVGIEDVDLAMDDEGDFVVTWDDFNYENGQENRYAQAYNSDGAVQGDRLTVATTFQEDASLFASAIAADENGDFVITWLRGSPNGTGLGLYAQLYQVPDPEIDLEEEVEEEIKEEIEGTPNNDRVEGTDSSDLIKGFNGNDTLIGGDGDDYLAGQNDADQIFCGDGNDNGFGGAGNDRIYGNNGDDLLAGGGGRDVVVGGDGADFLDGGYGADVLVGGAGADRFFFFKARGAVDKIRDFDVTEDLIVVNQSKFRTVKNPKALPLGVLAEERLFIGTAAPSTTGACFIYNDQNGELLFDSNGAGVGGRSKIVTLSKGLELTSQNFLVV